jgi:TPR repeat protein
MKEKLLIVILSMLFVLSGCEKGEHETKKQNSTSVSKSKSSKVDNELLRKFLKAHFSGELEKALNIALPEGQKGDAMWQYQTADVYASMNKNQKAFNWMNKSFDNGYYNAVHDLAQYYYYGTGTQVDYAKSKKLFIKFVELQLKGKLFDFLKANAYLKIGYMYNTGQGGKKDKIKAYKYYMESAKLSNKDAQNNLDILCSESPWACR